MRGFGPLTVEVLNVTHRPTVSVIPKTADTTGDIGFTNGKYLETRVLVGINPTARSQVVRFVCAILFHMFTIALSVQPSGTRVGESRFNPFRAPEHLPILNPSNVVPKNGFPVVKGLTEHVDDPVGVTSIVALLGNFMGGLYRFLSDAIPT